MGGFVETYRQNICCRGFAKWRYGNFFFDDDIAGFGLRIRAGGSRTFVFQYKLGAKQRRMTFGAFPAMRPEQAREIAGELHAKVKLGNDPAAQKAENKIRAANIADNLIRAFLEHQQRKLRPSSFREVARHLTVYAKPLHRMAIDSIDRRAIAGLLNDIANNSGAVTANRVRATLSSMFVWAMREGVAESNPVINTTKREEKSRDRVLSNEELQWIWNALEDNDYGCIIKLLMLTGQRANEIAGLRWFEVLDDRLDLAGDRTKNGRPHFVPLSEPALAILNSRPRRKHSNGRPRELVFGFGEGLFGGWSKCKAQLEVRILKKRKEAAAKAGQDPDDLRPLAHWTPHDLRRTFVTKLADDLKVLPHVIEAIINHVSGHKGGVAGIYNKATYYQERQHALALWGVHLLSLVEGDHNVVVLPAQLSRQ
jgi:integrase